MPDPGPRAAAELSAEAAAGVSPSCWEGRGGTKNSSGKEPELLPTADTSEERSSLSTHPASDETRPCEEGTVEQRVMRRRVLGAVFSLGLLSRKNTE